LRNSNSQQFLNLVCLVIYAFVTDLMFVSRMKEVAETSGGASLKFLRSTTSTDLPTEEPSLVIVDLEGRRFDPFDVIEAVRKQWPAVAVVAFYSHVKEELAARAEAAGVTLTLARSQFVRQLPELLKVNR
jgi:DNA-binding NarL/FixJ family response regulator